MPWEWEWDVVLWEMFLVLYSIYFSCKHECTIRVPFNYCKPSTNMFLYVKLCNMFPALRKITLTDQSTFWLVPWFSSFYFWSASFKSPIPSVPQTEETQSSSYTHAKLKKIKIIKILSYLSHVPIYSKLSNISLDTIQVLMLQKIMISSATQNTDDVRISTLHQRLSIWKH